MDVTLAPERLFVLEERLTIDEVQQRAMDRRVNAFASGLGGLLQRPKPDEIDLVAKQRRLEPFWHVSGRAIYVYERNRDYNVPASAPDVQSVTINGITHDGQPASGPQRTFRVPALEHCRAEFASDSYVDGLTGEVVADGPSVVSGASSEVIDPASLATDGTIVVPPEHRATFVVRKLMAEIMKPIQADSMLEESVTLEATDLYYRPIWAFEYAWRGKGKQGIVEIDSITGQTRQGKALVSSIKGMLSRDLLFDLGADTAGLLVPGGSIAVKLAKAAIDKKK
jgi:hypothetical protein